MPGISSNMIGSRFLKKYFLRDPDDWLFWISIAFVAKWSLFILKTSTSYHALPGLFGSFAGDSQSYLLPVENLIAYGSYDPDYRMPGLAMIYFPLLLAFPKVIACNILILLQVALASYACYCLAKTASAGFRSVPMFYLVFYSYTFSTYANLFDHLILTESLSTSSLIIGSYYFSVYLQSSSKKYLLFTGLWMAWMVFLRPVYAPLPIILVLILIYQERRRGSSVILATTYAILLLLPLIVFDSVWTVRNYQTHKKFIPLTSFYYPELESTIIPPMIEFVGSWGGDRTWWNPDAEIRWFGLGIEKGDKLPDTMLPEYIYTSKYNVDSLLRIRQYAFDIFQDRIDAETAVRESQYIRQRLSLYSKSVRVEKPLLYYVRAPLTLMKKFLFHSGTYNLFNKPREMLSPVELSVKILYSVYYLLTVALGLVGLGLIMFKLRGDALPLWVATITLYSIILFTFVLRQIEFRYFVPAYPFMTVSACYVVFMVGKYVHKTKGVS